VLVENVHETATFLMDDEFTSQWFFDETVTEKVHALAPSSTRRPRWAEGNAKQ